MPQNQPKLLLLWDRMGDYHRARWKAVQQITGKENCMAADLGAADGLYQWGTTAKDPQYIRLSNQPVEKVPPFQALKNFKKTIREKQITHVCIPGYGRPAYILMLLWCKLKGIKVLMFAESWYPGHPIGDHLKGLLVKNTTDLCFVSGKKAATHFSNRLNHPENRIIEGYSVVDNAHFASKISEIPKQTPQQLLCVARHAPEKNLTLLIEAFKKSTINDTWQLRIVGGGPEKEKLQKLSAGHHIQLDDWLSYDQLPEMYAQASCFILPSRFEPWGLVVNEAMSAGLPVILSDAVGALPDLLSDKNGWPFKHNRENELINILNQLAETTPEELNEMGRQSRQIIENFTPDIWAKKVVHWMRE